MIEDKIRKKVTTAVNDYSMIEEGDRIMVAVSGGKDSTILLLTLEQMRKKSKINFTLHPVILDQKQPGFKMDRYDAWLRDRGFDLCVIEEDTYGIVKDKVQEGKSFCGLCSRLRRGILYNYADAKGYTKIALGHHRDDLLESVLMSMFYNGRLSSMPPKLKSDDGRNTVIRPLVYVAESDLIEFEGLLDIPVIPCNLCGSQENLQRKKMKSLLQKLSLDHPDLGSSMLSSLQNVRPSQLMDRKLWNFDS